MNRKNNKRLSYRHFGITVILILGMIGIFLSIFVQTRPFSYYVALPESEQEFRVLPLNKLDNLSSFETKNSFLEKSKIEYHHINHQNNRSKNCFPICRLAESIMKARHCEAESNFTLSVLRQWESEESNAPELVAAQEFLSEFLPDSSNNSSNDSSFDSCRASLTSEDNIKTTSTVKSDETTLSCFVSLEDTVLIWNRLNFFSNQKSLKRSGNINNIQKIRNSQKINIVNILGKKGSLNKKYSFMRNPLNRIFFFAPEEVRLDRSPAIRLLNRAGTIFLTPTFLFLWITLGIGVPGLHLLCPITDAFISLLIFWEKLCSLSLRFAILIISSSFQTVRDRVKSDLLINLLLPNIETVRLLI